MFQAEDYFHTFYHRRELRQKIRYIRPDLDDYLFPILRKHLHPNTGEKNILALLHRIIIGSSQDMLDSMKSVPVSFNSTWAANVNNFTLDDSNFQILRDNIVANSAFRYITSCEEEFSAFARNIRYTAPIRATAERYYRLQNLAVGEVDFQGQNLAMFIRNLSDVERKRFSDWTSQLFGFAPQPTTSGGHVSIVLTKVKNQPLI